MSHQQCASSLLRTAAAFAAACSLLSAGSFAQAQRTGVFQGSLEAPAIRYSSAPLKNVVDTLNGRLDAGGLRLHFSSRDGYLRSVLDALQMPIDSQLLVFSNASFQARHISDKNPRAIFFRDDVQVAWVRGAGVIEIAAQDATLGTVFYTLEQKAVSAPRFKRAMVCLGCHRNAGTLGVPGLVMFSAPRLAGGAFGEAAYTTHATPVEERFGGWFVTGTLLPDRHRGNDVSALSGRSRALTSTAGLYEADGFVTNTSDIAALMVFSHQARTINLMIRAAWQARAANRQGDQALLREAAADLVDGLLFIDEARLETPVRGSSGFAERFASFGPRDRKGRSLRDLDLTHRLMRYPCSYLIYSPTFEAIPASMKALVYERLWTILSGVEKDDRHRGLALADRRAIGEILRDTKADLPAYFRPVVR